MRESEMKTLSMYVAIILLTVPCVIPKTLGDNDETTVAKLDTEYQAAVKRNDATTMARILANDFVLVTGRVISIRRLICLRRPMTKM
jgi:hypothetical protein